MYLKNFYIRFRCLAVLIMVFLLISCGNDDNNNNNNQDDDLYPPLGNAAVLLLIDEESIDNGNEPNNFSAIDVNDNIAEIGLREQLRFFQENTGEVIQLYTGQVGDEGWFALKTIPTSWKNAGPTQSGARNFVVAGPGLGGNKNDDLLDEIPDVIPLRATGLAMLTGEIILAIVYDSDISINYSPIEGNLQGENLGLVALEVLEVTRRTNGSSSDLPVLRVRIREVSTILNRRLHLFTNVPVAQSSSEPMDTTPPAAIPQIVLTAAE